MNRLLRLLAASAVAVVVMAALIAVSVYVVKTPFVSERLDALASAITVKDEEPEAIEAPPPRPAALPRVATRQTDCAGEAARLNLRLESARACSTNLDCVISAPRQRCVVALRVGMAGSIEDNLLRIAGVCRGALELPTLDTLCEVPDRGWVPYCAAGTCALHDSFDPSGQ